MIAVRGSFVISYLTHERSVLIANYRVQPLSHPFLRSTPRSQGINYTCCWPLAGIHFNDVDLSRQEFKHTTFEMKVEHPYYN